MVVTGGGTSVQHISFDHRYGRGVVRGGSGKKSAVDEKDEALVRLKGRVTWHSAAIRRT